ncbi:10360_t:CDS:1, partial [Racocetra fulgida]
MRCDAPSLSLADYNFIIQCRNNMPRTKVLNELKEKYSISQKHIYQIWRGEEKNRVAWDQPILAHDFVEEGRENIISPQIKDQGDLKKENSDLNDQIPPLDF